MIREKNNIYKFDMQSASAVNFMHLLRLLVMKDLDGDKMAGMYDALEISINGSNTTKEYSQDRIFVNEESPELVCCHRTGSFINDLMEVCQAGGEITFYYGNLLIPSAECTIKITDEGIIGVPELLEIEHQISKIVGSLITNVAQELFTKQKQG